jgi:DNA-binding CsgD family transcriptional regulator
MLGKKRHLVRVVEAAYQVELDEQLWLQGLADVFCAMRGGDHGLMAYLYDASHPHEGVQISAYSARHLDEAYIQGHLELNANTPAEEVRAVYHRGVRCGTVSEVLAEKNLAPKDHPVFAKMSQTSHVEDCWGLSASNPDGRGVGIAAPLARVSGLAEETRELWGLVGVHLATAYRLRRWERGGDWQAGPAIFEPDGSLVDADDNRIGKTSREVLGRAVEQIDRARSKRLRNEPDQAVPIWRGMVEGRWTLVEHFDSDGRRFVVAHPNDLRLDQPAPLTHAERQVVAYAAQGDSTERISYSLGLDEGTIDTLLASAIEKLGVGSVDDLIRLRQSLLP